MGSFTSPVPSPFSLSRERLEAGRGPTEVFRPKGLPDREWGKVGERVFG